MEVLRYIIFLSQCIYIYIFWLTKYIFKIVCSMVLLTEIEDGKIVKCCMRLFHILKNDIDQQKELYRSFEIYNIL